MEDNSVYLQSHPIEIIFKIFNYIDNVDLARLRKVSHAVAELSDVYQKYRVCTTARKCFDKISKIQYRTGTTLFEYYGTMIGTNLQSVITDMTYTSPCIDIPVEYSVRKINKKEVIMIYRSCTELIYHHRDGINISTTDVFELVMNYYSINKKQCWAPSSIIMHGSNNRTAQLYKVITGDSCYYGRTYEYNERQSGFIQ